jgi:hypothetical protein
LTAGAGNPAGSSGAKSNDPAVMALLIVRREYRSERLDLAATVTQGNRT